MGSVQIGGTRTAVWTGRILSVLVTLFLLMDGGMKLVKPPFVVEATAKLGYPESAIVPIGAVLVLCTILYVIPRTSVLGAILLTGYLGGAVASNVRAGTGWFNTLFPFFFAVAMWAGLWLRNGTLRDLVPVLT